MSPFILCKKIISAISPQVKFTFLVAFFSSLVVHQFFFSNLLLNHDSVRRIYSTLAFTMGMGRWFTPIAGAPSSFVLTPWFTGLFCSLYLALAACVVTVLFHLENRICIAIFSLFFVSFPAVTSVLTYSHASDTFMLAALFSLLAVWCTQKWRFGFFFGAVLLACAMGVYQAYVTMAAIVCLLLVLRKVWDGAAALRPVLVYAGRFLCMGILGAVLYYAIMRLTLALFNTTLTDYQNLSVLGQRFGSLFSLIGENMFRSFADFFATLLQVPGFTGSYSSLVPLLLYLVNGLFFLWILLHHRIWKTPWRLVLSLACLLAVPLVYCVLTVLTPDYGLSFIMRHSQVFLFVFVLLNLDFTVPAAKAVPVGFQWAAVLLTLLFCWRAVSVANIAYTNMWLRHEKQYSATLRLAQRIEDLDGYNPAIPVVFWGYLYDSPYYPHTSPELDAYIGDLAGAGGSYYAFGQEYFIACMRDLHNIAAVQPLEYPLALYDDPALAQIPYYPADGSIVYLEEYGIILVRLSYG